MFDQLIASEPEAVEFKNRKKYFLVSSAAVGVVFASAVIFSIYAAEFSLGTGNFELVEMLAPIADASEPESVQPEIRRAAYSPAESSTTSRQTIMSRVDEPTIMPTATSVVANVSKTRPLGEFKYDPRAGDSPGDSVSRVRETGPASGPTGLPVSNRIETSTADVEAPPPTAVKAPVKAPPTQSRGVINGLATSLPKPPYTEVMRSVGAQGKVDVQVLIDEKGRVVSARALSGHIMLRGPAEQAARNAKFSPTYLSDVPVKVTGVIVYNFTR
ncbi:MAG: energy transducer TonB [Pyrinomonadaceae bacterium]